MRPTRGLFRPQLYQTPRQRRRSLGALASMLAVLAAVTIYMRVNVESPQGTAQGDPSASPSSTAVGAQGGQAAVPGASAAQSGTPPQSAATDQDAIATQAAAPAPKQLLIPLSGERDLLHGFGWEYSPVFQDFRLHKGIDFQADPGEAVMAAASGKVVRIESDPAEGTVVTISHTGGMTTRYAGLASVTVAEQQEVQAGSPIGGVGQAGSAERSRGTGLHFEVQVAGESVDPLGYFPR